VFSGGGIRLKVGVSYLSGQSGVLDEAVSWPESRKGVDGGAGRGRRDDGPWKRGRGRCARMVGVGWTTRVLRGTEGPDDGWMSGWLA